MRHPLLEAFGVAARSIDAWQIIGLDLEEAKVCAFSLVEIDSGTYQAEAYLAAWGF